MDGLADGLKGAGVIILKAEQILSVLEL